MKYFVLSDIHGNLHALRAVLARAKEIGYDACVCLGDVVGYGANPIECWDLISSVADHIVLGNHEAGVIGNMDGFSKFASVSLWWTREQLASRPDILEAIKDLPIQGIENKLRFVHASPHRPDKFNYVNTIDEVRSSFTFDEDICFIGHTHWPGIHWFDCVTRESATHPRVAYGQPMTIQPGLRCLCNVGSVGQPRDRNRNARFVIYDTDSRELTFYQVPYDIVGAMRALHRSTLPPEISLPLAETLQLAH